MLKSDAPWFHRISFRDTKAIDIIESQVGFGRFKKKHGASLLSIAVLLCSKVSPHVSFCIVQILLVT